MLGARPDRHRTHRGPDRPAAEHYTIVIVTHNMQQAARVSERAAFFCLGELIEYDADLKIFSNPGEEADGRLRHRTVRLIQDLCSID